MTLVWRRGRRRGTRCTRGRQTVPRHVPATGGHSSWSVAPVRLAWHQRADPACVCVLVVGDVCGRARRAMLACDPLLATAVPVMLMSGVECARRGPSAAECALVDWCTCQCYAHAPVRVPVSLPVGATHLSRVPSATVKRCGELRSATSTCAVMRDCVSPVARAALRECSALVSRGESRSRVVGLGCLGCPEAPG